MTTNTQLEPTVFAIFGGAGDLTWRKLIPALFDLSQDRSLPDRFAVIAGEREVEIRQVAGHVRQVPGRFLVRAAGEQPERHGERQHPRQHESLGRDLDRAWPPFELFRREDRLKNRLGVNKRQ